METENGENWKKLKLNFLEVYRQLPNLDQLKLKIIKNTKKYKIVTSPEISKISIMSFSEWIFGDNCLSDDDLQNIYLASIEWRKEIAIKAKGDMEIKNQTVEIYKKLIKKSSYTFSDKYDDIYMYSIIIQPFIISPSINISDIAVNYQMNLDVETNIKNNHPFPIFERTLNIDGKTNIYVIHISKLKILPFGYGERQCLGKTIAISYIKTFFEEINKSEIIFKPSINHMYSGRDNDNSDTFTMTFYQISHLLCKLLFFDKKNLSI
jgi:hypothetical protein